MALGKVYYPGHTSRYRASRDGADNSGRIRQAPGAHRLVGWLQIGWAATIQLGGLWGHVLFEHGWPASYMGHTKNPNCSSH